MDSEATLNIVQRTLFLLEQVPYQSLDSEEVAAIAGKMLERRFAAGETIVAAGDTEGRSYVVVEGEVEQLRGEIVVRRATRGMAFGLFGLMGVPSEEAARAVQATHTLVLTREDFIEAVLDNPPFAVGVIRGLARTLEVMTRRIEVLERAIAAQRKDKSP